MTFEAPGYPLGDNHPEGRKGKNKGFSTSSLCLGSDKACSVADTGLRWGEYGLQAQFTPWPQRIADCI